jgi:hypothetical protein
MRNQLLFFSAVIVLISCGKPKELAFEKYGRWISSEENGLVKSKEVKNASIQVRYLPSEYLAYKEFVGSPDANFDTIWNAYKCGLTFQVTLSADKADKTYGNLMYYQVPSQEELTARIRYLSFSIEEFISLKHGDETYLPVLSNFEGFDQLGNRVSFQVAFIVPDYNCAAPQPSFNDITLTFDDPFWDIGSNNFLFEKGVFTELPKITR